MTPPTPAQLGRWRSLVSRVNEVLSMNDIREDLHDGSIHELDAAEADELMDHMLAVVEMRRPWRS